MSMITDIEEFHEKYGIAYHGEPRSLPDELRDFRIKFMEEELSEFRVADVRCRLVIADKDDAEITHQLEKQLDALVDLIYVVLGTAHLQGFNIEEAWYRVHQANMKKIRTPNANASTRGSKYDVIKPPGWTPPSHKDLVENHIHKQKTLDP